MGAVQGRLDLGAWDRGHLWLEVRLGAAGTLTVDTNEPTVLLEVIEHSLENPFEEEEG